MRYLPTPEQAARMTPEELRTHFLVSGLFVPGESRFEMVDLDRVTLGGIVPLAEPITLIAPTEFAAASFTERREVGILSIGGSGTVVVDGAPHRTAKLDVVYVGCGPHDVMLSSDDPASPARFFLVSYPSREPHPATLIAARDADASELGSQEKANRRRLARYIHQQGAKSSQLVMGVTTLREGSVWNTMPPHTHVRRTEIYLYFDLPADAVVFHMMGPPDATQHVVVRDGEVALSPSWSIHSGCGTSSYSFCWAMGGENQAFADMQGFDMSALR